jgi:sortase A
VPTKAPELGSPIGILEAGAIQLQQVAVEGVAPAQTQMGPGHVAGTAAPGQPGNSAFVGRRSAFGGTFGALDQLTKGERILVSTTQGQVVYTVETVRQQTITTDPVPSASPLGNIPSSTGGTAEAPPDLTAGDTVSVDALYGPTDDDRLTLVTSASASPLNASDATVVIAKLEGTPFTPTPQNGRTDSLTGLAGESGAMAAVLLTTRKAAAAVAAAIVLYRRSNPKVAYLLTAAPLLVAMVLLAESLSRLLPSWF